MTTITLPEHLKDTHLLAGIEFTDGVATVERLGSHARRFLELTGATLGDETVEAVAPAGDAPAAGDAVKASKRKAAE